MTDQDADLGATLIFFAFKAPVYVLTVWALLKYVGCVG